MPPLNISIITQEESKRAAAEQPALARQGRTHNKGRGLGRAASARPPAWDGQTAWASNDVTSAELVIPFGEEAGAGEFDSVASILW